jgi:hypothetical protein
MIIIVTIGIHVYLILHNSYENPDVESAFLFYYLNIFSGSKEESREVWGKVR